MTQDTKRVKPKAKMIGEDGNVFNLLGIARLALKRSGQRDLVDEMTEKVTSSKSYDEALAVMTDYVEMI